MFLFLYEINVGEGGYQGSYHKLSIEKNPIKSTKEKQARIIKYFIEINH